MALTDLTRISTSGIATGTSLSGAILHGDAHFRGTQVGVTSALFDSSDNALEFNNDVKLKFAGTTFQIYHGSNVSHIAENGTGPLRLSTDEFQLMNSAQNKTMIYAAQNLAVSLNYNGNTKIQTTDTGAVVTGILTATSFSGPVVGNTNNASGISTFYDLRVSNNLTVEGSTTTLDTNLIGVDRVEVGANSNTVTGIAVTQSGTADIVRLYDGSNQVLTVTDGGSIGIGTTNPQNQALSIHANDYEALKITTNNDGVNGPEVRLYHNSASPAASDYLGQILFSGNDSAGNSTTYSRITGFLDDPSNGSEDGSIAFFTRGNGTFGEKLRIKSTGYVGINTTGLYPLDVLETTDNAGLISITGANTGYDTGFLIRNGSNAKWYLINDVNGAGNHSFEIRGDGWSGDRFLTLTQTGKLGVNNTNPNAYDQFVVSGTGNLIAANATSGYAGIGFYESGTGRFFLRTLDGGNGLAFYRDNTNEALRIDSSGNVRLMTSTQNSYPGVLANSNAINFTLGSTAGAEPRIYLFGSGNGQTTAKDISIITGSDTGDVLIRASKTTITSTVNEEIFRIQTSHGNSGSVQGKALMGFDHFNVSDKPAILIGSEEEGNSSHKGSFVIKLKDAAATDDDPIIRFKITSAGKIGINNSNPQEILQIGGNISLGNRSDGASRYIGKGTNGSGGVMGDSSANPNSGWIGFVSGSGTGAEDQIRFGTLRSGTSGGERMRLDGLGRLSIGAALGSHNDNSELLKIQQNTASAILSIIGSNDTHSTLALGDEDDFNRARIRADHTHDLLGFWTADAERLRITDKGVLSSFLNTSGSGNNTGNAYYHRPLLEITHNPATPASQIKITTNISWTGDGTHAHSVRIAGFRYGGRDTVDIQICWHVYNNEFYNRVATSSGSYAPTITLGVESGKVVIHLTNPGYWPKFYVESLYHPYGSKEQGEGWSWSDSAISGDSGLPVNTVPYKWDAGGLSFNDNHSNNGQGDLTIADGNLVVASGHGINFSATGDGSGSQTSELLDDYEEGTWTAVMNANTNPSNTAQNNPDITRSVTGTYTKVGRQVTVYAFWNNIHDGGGNDLADCQLIYVSGLPYAAGTGTGFSTQSNTSSTYQRGIYPRWSTSTNANNHMAMYNYVYNGNSVAYLQTSQSNGPGTLYQTVSDSTSHMYYSFSLTYMT